MRFLPILAVIFYAATCSNVSAQDRPNYKSVTITSGASESSVLDISTMTPGAGALLGLFMPAAWTTASVTFSVSPTCAAPWYNAYDSTGTEYTVVVGTSRYVGLDPAYFVGIRCVKLRSGTSAIPVNQGGDRIIRMGFGRF